MFLLHEIQEKAKLIHGNKLIMFDSSELGQVAVREEDQGNFLG